LLSATAAAIDLTGWELAILGWGSPVGWDEFGVGDQLMASFDPNARHHALTVIFSGERSD
jgi:hypothetical protein